MCFLSMQKLSTPGSKTFHLDYPAFAHTLTPFSLLHSACLLTFTQPLLSFLKGEAMVELRLLSCLFPVET